MRFHLRFELYVSLLDALNEIVVGEKLELAHVLLDFLVLLEVVVKLESLLLGLRHIAIGYFQALIPSLIKHLSELGVQLVIHWRL